MPYLGKDWRSDGDHWIKTEQGWQKAKLFQFLADPLDLQPKLKMAKVDDSDDESDYIENINLSLNEINIQPCLYLDQGCTAPNRENSAPQSTISDILIKLDFNGSALKLKRFSYVYKLTSLIINEKFDQISGTAQSTLLTIINMMLNHVLNTRIHIHLIKNLLIMLKTKIENSSFNHIGSKKLWSNHLDLINKWLKRIKNHEKKFWAIKNSYDNQSICFLSNLPYECKIQILSRVNCGYDLLNLSECDKQFYEIISKEVFLWRKLCFYKFSSLNILNELKEENVEIENEDEIINNNELEWRKIYFKLNSRQKPLEVYVDVVQKCVNCKCLFWKESSHPCAFIDDVEILPVIETLTPQKLFNFMFN